MGNFAWVQGSAVAEQPASSRAQSKPITANMNEKTCGSSRLFKTVTPVSKGGSMVITILPDDGFRSIGRQRPWNSPGLESTPAHPSLSLHFRAFTTGLPDN